MIIAGCCAVMMQTIHTNANHISSIFKFFSFELLLIAALSITEVESKHFLHALFLKTLLLKLPPKRLFQNHPSTSC